MLPKIAEGDANKLWIVPSEIGDALKGLGGALGSFRPDAAACGGGSNSQRRRHGAPASSPPSTDATAPHA